MNSNELYHFGIKGMKWGLRRYQNYDGTLTTAGKARYGADSLHNATGEGRKQYDRDVQAQRDIYEKSASLTRNAADISRRLANNQNAKVTKSIKQMSDSELRSKINRIQMEKQYAMLTSSDTKRGARIATSILENAGSVIGIAGGTLGIILAINQLKG